MESSKNVDIPPVIKAEYEKRLARVFVKLRQNDRKVKLAKKEAELHALRGDGKSEQLVRQPETIAHGVNAEQHALTMELFHEDTKETKSPTEVVNVESVSSIQELTREIEELHKSINFKEFETSGVITAQDLGSAFRSLNRVPTKSEIQWMIWEVDDDMDGCIDWDEFRGAYARGIVDKQGSEPNQLFYFIQFVLSDADDGGSVSFSDVKIELQRIYGTTHLISRVKKALGASTEQLELQKHTLGQFLDAMLTTRPTSFNVSNQFPSK